MEKLVHNIQLHSGKIGAFIVITFFSFLLYKGFQAPVEGFEASFVYLLKEYGYVILFAWGILEGEAGLIMAGLLSHTGDMTVYIAVFVGGLGGFVGDQIYFYIGRYNKKYVHKKFRGQRRKFAFAHLLLQKHGWPIIFAQRYMYGMRTIIPISIGLTRYSAKQFAFINLISAWCWAAITIVPVWYFGDAILVVLDWAKEHWYFALPIVAIGGTFVIWYFNKMTQKHERKLKTASKNGNSNSKT